MRHGYFGKGLSRNTNERRRLLMVLSRALIRYGQIKTTLTKAKAVQPIVEKLVTNAKKGKRGELIKVLADKKSVKLLTSWAKTRFSSRNSGFTRIIKLEFRRGDGSEEVLFSFVDPVPTVEKKTEKIEKPVKTEERHVKRKTPEKKTRRTKRLSRK